MDIVPRIRDGTSLPQDTPFFRCSEEARYDGGGRDQFVTRFMDTLLKSPGQINAVVQSWLFFGTLVQYSDVFGTAFHDHAFIDRQPGESEKLEHTDIVHTEALGHLIETWTAICAQRFELSMISSKQYVTVNAYLREKRYLKDDKGNTGFNHAVAGLDILQNTYTCLHKLHEHGFEVNDIVWDSVVLLTCRLLNVFYFLFRGLWDPAFGERTVRLQQMLGWDIGTRHSMKLLAHNQWCPREVVILKSILDADPCTLLFCAQVDRSKSASLHTQCDESTCHAYQIDESIYETQHFFPECQCSFVGIAPEDEHKLIKPQTSSRLFKKGSGTAMMIWKEGLLEITQVALSAVNASNIATMLSPRLGAAFTSRCVAISHVWADGLGNAQANALPECQVSRLQVLANKLFPSDCWPVPFWIDSLCLPVTNHEARRIAIAEMERVYKGATRVLVLDSGLVTVNSKGMTEEEIGMRIMCSGWARRLWTLQEGAFLPRVHFQFADTTYTYDQLHASIKSRWATKLDQIRTQDKKAIEKVKRQSHKINHPVWARISSFFKDLSIFRHLDSFISIENGLREGSVMRRMYSRTISKPTDEALVFSSMLHVSSGSAGKLLALEPADRIRAVFKTLDEVPLELIYFDTPRYEEDGCRWMPRSLLSQASATAQRMPNNTLDAWIETDTNRENVLGLSFKQHARVVSFPSRLGHVPSKVYWNGYAGRVHEAGSDRPLELPLTHDLILLMPVLDPFGSPFSTLSRFTAVLASIKKIPVEPKKFDDAEDAWPGSLNTFKHTWVVRHEGLVHFDAVSEAKGYTRMALVPLMSGASNAARYGFRLT